MYQKIVVPVDLAHEDKADLMIKIARQLANDDAKIILANIVEEFPSIITPELPEKYLEHSQEHARDALRKIAETAGFDVDIDVRVGHPARAILAVAENNDADAIVIASHRPGLQDYLLGSTAGRVVRHAKCTVVVVR